jgi:hypothetical protein
VAQNQIHGLERTATKIQSGFTNFRTKFTYYIEFTVQNQISEQDYSSESNFRTRFTMQTELSLHVYLIKNKEQRQA